MSSKRARGTTLALLLTLLGGSFLVTGSLGLAQESSPARPSHLHSGDCDELGPIIQPLNALTVPPGEVLGNSDAVVAEAAFSNISQGLEELVAADHALKVHLSTDQIQIYLACGDIGGALDAEGALIVGLKEIDNSGYTGIAYLVPAADGTTNVSVLIAEVLPGGGPAATPVETGGVQSPAEGDGPNVVGVALNEFTITLPDEVSAGPTQFNVSNVGAVPHNFVIEGDGVAEQLTDNLPTRQTGTIEVDLQPGTYTVYCPVGNGAHRANGMERQLIVGA